MTKQLFSWLGLAALLTIFPQVGFAQVNVIYQDLFEGDGLAVNNSVGGGLDSGIGLFTATAGDFPVFQDNGTLSLTGPTNGPLGGRMAAMAWTQNAFSVSNGFSLEVVFDINDVGVNPVPGTSPYPSNSFSFGLWDQASSSADIEGAFISATPSAIVPPTLQDGIGLNLTSRSGDATPGLVQSDASLGGFETLLSNAQTITTGTSQTFNLSVDQNGNFSYQLNGATPTTGVTNLDVLNDYHFVTFTQGSDGESLIRSVRLTTPAAVPEPSSAGLLALSVIGLVSCRRRKRG